MTPRRFAAVIVALLLPALLWAMVEHGKNDLLLKTRSLMGQAKKDRTGLFEGFFGQYRLPEGPLEVQAAKFSRIWGVMRACTPESAEYGDRTPVTADDGRERERRQVTIRGRSGSGEAVQFQVDWVRHAATWYIHDCSGWGPPDARNGGVEEGNGSRQRASVP